MRVSRIEGTITLTDGSTSSFLITTDGGWTQWGAIQSRLGHSVDAVDTMARALMEDDLLASDYDPEVQ